MQHVTVIPIDSHTAFYFPPFAKANGPPFSPERETCCILSVNQLLHACLLTKWKKCNILSLFLQIHIVESTIPRRSSVPLSLQKGAAYGMLPICKAFVCLPFYKRLFHIPLQSSWGGTRPLSVSSSSILSFIQTYSILLSTICCADGPPLSPEREICDILRLSFIQTKWNQLSTDFVGPPFFQERSIVSHAFL